MTTSERVPHTTGTCTIEIAPVTIEAGRDFSLDARVVCEPACDREGERVLVLDEEGEELGHLVLSAYDGDGANPSDEITLTAPVAAGPHTWQAVVPECDAGDVHFGEASAEFMVHVVPHKIDVVAWDVPRTVVAGERFSIKLGAKCSGQCVPAGWTITIADETGATVASAPLGDTPWPRTKALHYAEVTLHAPAEPGRFRWTATLSGVAEDMPHEVSETRFGVHCTAPPECDVSIAAIDVGSGQPVAGATVQLHPYRARTDADGIARLSVPKGEYRLLVSGSRHFARSLPLTVDDDINTRIGLAQDQELTEADLWS